MAKCVRFKRLLVITLFPMVALYGSAWAGSSDTAGVERRSFSFKPAPKSYCDYFALIETSALLQFMENSGQGGEAVGYLWAADVHIGPVLRF